LPYFKETEESSNIGTLKKKDIQEFFKLLKQKQQRYCKKNNQENWKIKYYEVGEYGTKTNRPHYHAIVFNLRTEITMNEIENLWNKGHVHIGTVTPKSVNYVAKYIIDREPTTTLKRQKPFSSMSKKLGHHYLLANYNLHRPQGTFLSRKFNLTCLTGEGYRIALPRYYKKKIFHEEIPELQEILNENLHEYYMICAAKALQRKKTEIEQIRLKNPDRNPIHLYNEREMLYYNRIRIKSESLNTF
jgi:hypothetical protein